MLLEFSCSNYRSIKDKITLSFVAGADNTNEEELGQYASLRILRAAVIYGANGSGKSNFLNALVFMKNLVINSIYHQPGEKINQYIHKLNDKESISQFSIQFIKDEIRYAYGFSIKEGIVYDEYLYYFPNGRQTKIFERENLTIIEGSKFKGNFGFGYEVLKENRLFLSCLANYSKLKEVQPVYMFFKDDIVIYNPQVNNWRVYSAEILEKDDSIKKTFIKIMNSLGTQIIDIKSKVQYHTLDDLPKNIFPDQLKSILPRDTVTPEINVKFIYDQFETDLIYEESSGVQRLFELICPLIDIMNHGKILIIDEIETSLHEMLVYQILQLFKTANKNHFAQILFSTHDTSILNAQLFRRDQIWFTQLDKNRATDLYSLNDINNVRKNENFKNGYINGKYGAIPILSSNIMSLFIMEGDDSNE